LPSHQQAFGRAIPRKAAAFVFWNFDWGILVTRLIGEGPEGKGWCRMTHPVLEGEGCEAAGRG
jgi:hypothetical protein